MAQTNSNSKHGDCPQINQGNASPDPETLGFTDDVRPQQPERGYGASNKLPSAATNIGTEDQPKIDMPIWMAKSFSKLEHSPAQTRLKWCGCLAYSQCSHFSECSIPDSQSSQWVPLPFFIPDGARQPQQQGMRNTARGLGEKRENFREPFHHFDIRQVAKLKAQVLSHPMYEQMLAAHVGCLRVATPVDHLQTIEAQLATTHHIATRYSMLGHNTPLVGEEREELDRFMAAYTMLLHAFKEQLQEHVRVQAMEAVVSCWELEQALVSLTGVAPGEGNGATMSDEEEEAILEAGMNYYDPEFFEGGDNLGLGPLIPTESERSLMERVRQELKSELKQGYRNRIVDVREEILRKRRAGKLPSETTSILKRWWNGHSKWPYPTEDEKARLVQETGLELKQINNWFINQRKRNWHSHSSMASTNLQKTIDASRSVVDGQTSHVSLALSYDGDKGPMDANQEGNFSSANG